MTNLPTPEAQDKKFDIDAALNKKGFMDFINRYPDAQTFDLKNMEEVERRLETFNSLPELKERFRSIHTNEMFQKDLGIKLGKEELACLDAFIEESAVNPEKLKEVMDTVEACEKIPEEIKTLEDEMKSLGGKDELSAEIAALEKHKGELELVEGSVGLVGDVKMTAQIFWNGLKRISLYAEKIPYVVLNEDYVEGVKSELDGIQQKIATIESLKDKHGKLSEGKRERIFGKITDQISEREMVISQMEGMDIMKNNGLELLQAKKKELYAGVAKISGLSQLLQKNVMNQLNGMARGGIDSMDKTMKRYDDLVKKAGEFDLALFNGAQGEQFKLRMDQGFEAKAAQQIEQVVKHADMGDNALTRLEKSLEPLLAKDKLGTKEGDELRSFYAQTLEGVAERLDVRVPENNAKRLIICRIISKLHN